MSSPDAIQNVFTALLVEEGGAEAIAQIMHPTVSRMITDATTALEAENARLKEALEAADSMAASFEKGELAGWEVALYRRRRQALSEREGV